MTSLFDFWWQLSCFNFSVNICIFYLNFLPWRGGDGREAGGADFVTAAFEIFFFHIFEYLMGKAAKSISALRNPPRRGAPPSRGLVKRISLPTTLKSEQKKD